MISNIVSNFLYFQTSLKICHWQTFSYSVHKATDELYESISENIDKFVEVLQGTRNERVFFSKPEYITLTNVDNVNKNILLTNFKNYLLSLTSDNIITETDLINIRDEMLGDIDQTLYLFTFKN